MWDQVYVPVAGSLGWSAAVASLPIVVLLIALGVLRLSAWKSGLLGLITAILLAIFVYRMPVPLALNATAYGAAFGLFPIAWIVFWAVALYRLTVETTLDITDGQTRADLERSETIRFEVSVPIEVGE